VLSALPREMCLPDPVTQREVLENLPEMDENPRLHREMSALLEAGLRTRLDTYLLHRTVDFLSELPNLLTVNPSPGCKYNISVINAIVIHVGTLAIDSIHEKRLRISVGTVANTAFMDVFQSLVVSLCTQGRYLLFNAISNQLRYPNSHTNYFSCTLLYLFRQAHRLEVQEQITRILLERLIAVRPHPWGLTMTFSELIRNNDYQFWKSDFVRCAPEIEKLLHCARTTK